jgi:AcrR family transcriptional regulator
VTRAPSAPERPRRGAPADTRARIVAAAAEVFNREGYFATDSNRLARAAGYSPGTFYKHFADKRSLFLAVYREWVQAEWRALGAAMERGASIGAVVDLVLAHHARWAGVRRSLAVLVATDDGVRRVYRALRGEQLAALAARRGRRGSRERDALLLFTVERAADALAGGEARALGLDARRLRAALVRVIVRAWP